MADHTHAHAHPRESVRSALVWALALNAGFLLVEAVAGFVTGSLALLSDAAHMVSDVAALTLALGASWLAGREASSERSFGYLRTETLGAFVNGLALLLAVAFIVKEAVERLVHGVVDVPALPVLVVGLLGLAINLASAWRLYRSDRGNLNIRGALYHMLADALGSVGAVAASVFLYLGYPVADPIVSLVVAALVLWGTVFLLRDSARVLLEFAPPDIRADRVREALEGIDGVEGVHDLHLWTLDGRVPILTAHLVARADRPVMEVRARAELLLHRDFGIHHSTLQMELAGDCRPSTCALWEGSRH